MNADHFDAAVIGGGPAGLTAALTLSRTGRSVVLVDPAPDARPPKGRTTAIMRPQAAFLRQLGAWPDIGEAAALRGLRIVNRPARGLANTVVFHAAELGVECFAWNVPNDALLDALHAAARPEIVCRASKLRELRRRDGRWRLDLDDGGTLTVALVVGADGKASLVRETLRISVRRHDYHQIANTARLTITGGHDDISTEVHKPGGPFTTVPAGAGVLSLVWLERRAEGERIRALDDAAFLDAVAAQDEGRHGTFTAVQGRAAVAVTGLLAQRVVGPGALILGEAAHAVSPLGAQGFNLTLRDCKALADLGAHPRFASADALKTYERSRLGETRMSFWFIDALNRAVLRPELPVGVLRGVGLGSLGVLPPIRRELMQRLMQPPTLALA